MKQTLKEHLQIFCDKTLMRFFRYLTFRAMFSNTNIQSVYHNRAIADSAITGLILEYRAFKNSRTYNL